MGVLPGGPLTAREAVLLLVACVCGFSWLTYYVGNFVVGLLPKQDLKKKYGATWALVTGASSGIGKSLAEKLASQGLNVVLVAIQDDLLDATTAELAAKFPALEFRKVGVNLGTRAEEGGYLQAIAAATEDIDVQCVFNNAGFMLTGFFDKTRLPLQLVNLECNAVSGVQISHLFIQRMLEKKLKGCIVFTSSAAAYQCTPFTVLYGATKAFVSSFAAGLNVELRNRGIDVISVHPSPVASRFYDKAHKIDALDFFKQFAVKPEELPDEMLRGIGRCSWRDIGATAVMFRTMMKVFDYNFFAFLIAIFAPLMGDYQKALKYD